jgi:hypothetical protein
MWRGSVVLGLVLVFVSLLVSSGDGPAAVRLGEHHSLGPPVRAGNLTVWPVFADEPTDLGEFLTLQEATEQAAAEVREVGAPVEGGDGARVGTLVIENRGERPILVCAGTVVTGGKQDRQIAQDFVVQAGTTVPVEAFCVERGRWALTRLGERTKGKFLTSSVQAFSKVRALAQYEQSQQAVWGEVERAQAAAIAQNLVDELSDHGSYFRGSSSFAVMTEVTNESAGRERERRMEAVREHFDASQRRPVGFAYAVNGRPVNVRAFAHPRLLERQFEPFLASMVSESLLARTETPTPRARAQDVAELVRSMEAAEESIEETKAFNRNGLRRAEGGYHARCYVPAGNRWVSLTQDWTAK